MTPAGPRGRERRGCCHIPGDDESIVRDAEVLRSAWMAARFVQELADDEERPRFPAPGAAALLRRGLAARPDPPRFVRTRRERARAAGSAHSCRAAIRGDFGVSRPEPARRNAARLFDGFPGRSRIRLRVVSPSLARDRAENRRRAIAQEKRSSTRASIPGSTLERMGPRSITRGAAKSAPEST